MGQVVGGGWVSVAALQLRLSQPKQLQAWIGRWEGVTEWDGGGCLVGWGRPVSVAMLKAGLQASWGRQLATQPTLALAALMRCSSQALSSRRVAADTKQYHGLGSLS